MELSTIFSINNKGEIVYCPNPDDYIVYGFGLHGKKRDCDTMVMTHFRNCQYFFDVSQIK